MPLVVVLLGGLVLAAPAIGRWYLVNRALPKASRRIGRKITARKVEVSFRRVVLEGLEVRSPGDPEDAPTFTAKRIDVAYRVAALLGGKLVAQRVTVSAPHLRLWRRAPGKSNVEELLARLRPRTKKTAEPATSGAADRVRVERVEVKGGRIEAEDKVLAVRAQVGGFEATIVRGRPLKAVLTAIHGESLELPNEARAAEVRVEMPWPGVERGVARYPSLRVRGGEIEVLPRLALTGIQGRVAPNKEHIAVDLAGSYGGATAKLWAAEGWLDPEQRRGKVQVRAAKFRLDRIASILRPTPVIRPTRTEVSGRLDIDIAGNRIDLVGGLAFKDLNLFHPRVSHAPVLGLSVGAGLDMTLEREPRKLTLRALRVVSRGVEATLSGSIEGVGRQSKIALRLQMPPRPCQKVLEAIPPALVPELQEFKLRGKFSVDVATKIDFANLDDVELGGSIAIRHCKVVDAPPRFTAKRLDKPFEHIVEPMPGEMVTVLIGPESPSFTPFAEISPHIIHTFLTTEDAGFFKHHGFIVSQFKAALSRNLKRGGFRIGASTITMQTVKNVLLSQEKTLSRKLQEIFLTWYVEQQLSKERLMEIYLNAIEFGPGIYGIGQATRHYFNKTPQEINALEAAFFGTILPNPKKRYIQYCKGKPDQKWDKYVRRVLRRIHSRLWISDEEYDEVKDLELVFNRPEGLRFNECKKGIEERSEVWAEERHRRLRAVIARVAPEKVDVYMGAAAEHTSKGGGGRTLNQVSAKR